MKIKIICLLLVLFWGSSQLDLAQGMEDYPLKFSGYYKLTPSEICEVLDLIILMQHAQEKVSKGIPPSEISLFEGTLPPTNLKIPFKKTSPHDVYQMLSKAINLFFSQEEIPHKPPSVPKIVVPGDVFVLANIGYDFLGQLLTKKGVYKVGNLKALRHRYVSKLAPHHCLARATLIYENWKAIYQK